MDDFPQSLRARALAATATSPRMRGARVPSMFLGTGARKRPQSESDKDEVEVFGERDVWSSRPGSVPCDDHLAQAARSAAAASKDDSNGSQGATDHSACAGGADQRAGPSRLSEKKQRVQPDEKQYETYAAGIVERRKEGDLEGGEPEGGWQALQRALVVLQRTIEGHSRALEVMGSRGTRNARIQEKCTQARRQLELGLTSSEFQTLLSQEQRRQEGGDGPWWLGWFNVCHWGE